MAVCRSKFIAIKCNNIIEIYNPFDFQIMMGDDSMSDDVFEVEDERSAYVAPGISERLAGAVQASPSPTGYRDYQPPAEVLQNYSQQQSSFAKSRLADNVWSSYKRDQDNPENYVHKVCITIIIYIICEE